MLALALFLLTAPQVKAPHEDAVFSREVIAYDVVPAPAGQEAEVKYQYLGNPLPEKLAPDEDVAKRTETSYTRVIVPGTSEAPPTYMAVFYSKPTFTRQGNEWRYIEHATTTTAAFNALHTESPLATLFLPKAHAADIYSGAGDGWTQNRDDTNDCGTRWSATHDAATGTSFSYTATTLSVSAMSFSSTFLSLFLCTIDRTFLPFDTSSIPSNATITAATLNLYTLTKTNTDNDGTDFLTVTQTSQATHTVLANADYDQCGAVSNPTEGIDSGQRKDISSITTSAYLVFTLNATGNGWIKKSGQASACSATAGITCLGVREGHDVTNAAIVSGFDVVAENTATFSSSEQSGTSQDPYLAVTYTASSAAFWQFQDY